MLIRFFLKTLIW